MKILIGKNYDITLKVLENESFTPKDISTLTSAVFEIYSKDTVNNPIPVITISTVGTGTDSIEIIDAINGKLTVHISSTNTNNLTESLGSKEDRYYNKSEYKGYLVLGFSDSSDTNVYIKDIKAVK